MMLILRTLPSKERWTNDQYLIFFHTHSIRNSFTYVVSSSMMNSTKIECKMMVLKFLASCASIGTLNNLP
jgi:hypothetical protein